MKFKYIVTEPDVLKGKPIIKGSRIRIIILSLVILLLAACQADPNVIPDNEPSPSQPAEPLVCDTLPAPNSIFSNGIGQLVILLDSLKTGADTLVCIENFAMEVEAFSNGKKYCQSQYSTVFQTNWRPMPERYSVVFKNYVQPNFTILEAYSTPSNDFESGSQLVTSLSGIYTDSLKINGLTYHGVIQYTCKSTATCTFATAFVFAQKTGLVAMKRKGKWWTKR